jgi:hypothetical protein
VVASVSRTNFSELQAELAAGNQDKLTFYAFELLWRDRDLRRLPQIESASKGCWIYSRPFVTMAMALLVGWQIGLPGVGLMRRAVGF